jgi:hypothetical protein
MIQITRTPFTLVGGIAIGLLIGGFVHAADAGSVPCAWTTPAIPPPPPPGHVLTTFEGDTTMKPDIVGFYTSKKFTYRGPVTVTFTGTPVDPKKISNGTVALNASVVTAINIVGQVAIAPGDKPTQTIKETFSADDNQCKFGCAISVIESANMRWHIVATK